MCRRAPFLVVATAVIAAALGVGCGAEPWSINYVPATMSLPPARASVRLNVGDERPTWRGRGSSQVGLVRGQFGGSRSVYTNDPNVAIRNVGDATSDALRRNGVGVRAGGRKTLDAWVSEFWMDGWVGYTATITVQYQLRDASGRPIWGAAVRGGAGGAKIASRSRTLATTLFQGALEDLAANAAAAFASPAFQQALAM